MARIGCYSRKLEKLNLTYSKMREGLDQFLLPRLYSKVHLDESADEYISGLRVILDQKSKFEEGLKKLCNKSARLQLAVAKKYQRTHGSHRYFPLLGEFEAFSFKFRNLTLMYRQYFSVVQYRYSIACGARDHLPRYKRYNLRSSDSLSCSSQLGKTIHKVEQVVSYIKKNVGKHAPAQKDLCHKLYNIFEQFIQNTVFRKGGRISNEDRANIKACLDIQFKLRMVDPHIQQEENTQEIRKRDAELYFNTQMNQIRFGLMDIEYHLKKCNAQRKEGTLLVEDKQAGLQRASKVIEIIRRYMSEGDFPDSKRHQQLLDNLMLRATRLQKQFQAMIISRR